MLFLVDGYNVTMADDATRRMDRDSQRLALVRRLAARCVELLGHGAYVVIFDGGALREDEVHGPVHARFSADESADDVIVRLAVAAASGGVTVVTSDRELRSRVREHAGRSIEVLPVSTVFEGAQPARRRRPARGHPHGGLPSGHENITRELTEIWLPEEDER
jgi:hypothetical protein